MTHGRILRTKYSTTRAHSHKSSPGSEYRASVINLDVKRERIRRLRNVPYRVPIDERHSLAPSSDRARGQVSGGRPPDEARRLTDGVNPKAGAWGAPRFAPRSHLIRRARSDRSPVLAHNLSVVLGVIWASVGHLECFIEKCSSSPRWRGSVHERARNVCCTCVCMCT
jgi:hypothetical protein